MGENWGKKKGTEGKPEGFVEEMVVKVWKGNSEWANKMDTEKRTTLQNAYYNIAKKGMFYTKTEQNNVYQIVGTCE